MKNIKFLILLIGITFSSVFASEVEVALSAVPTYKNIDSTNSILSCYSILCSDLIIGGNSTVILSNGIIHANNLINLKGNVKVTGLISVCQDISATKNNTIIDGNVMAKAIDSKIIVNGTRTITNVSQFSAWPILPIDSYRTIAKNNNMYYNGDVKWNKKDIQLNTVNGVVPGGIIYVHGFFECNPETPVSLKTCIVAEKGIKWNAGDLIAPDGYPAMVVLEPVSHDIGIINIGAGNRILSGLIYSMRGNIELNGSGSIYGHLFAKDTICFRGTPDVIAYTNFIDNLKNYNSFKAVVTAWEK